MGTLIALDQVKVSYHNRLHDLNSKFVEMARTLGRMETKIAYANLKEEMHREYIDLGAPLLESGFLDLSLVVFSALEQTLQKCRDITGAVDFSKGLAFFYQGRILICQENFTRGVALIQLAWEEDKELTHRGAAEKILEDWSDDACKYIKELLSCNPEYDALDPLTILNRLGNERYRLMAIITDYQTRLTDWRSLALKDAAETNMMRICKLTEYYLKTKLNVSDMLGPLIEKAFSKDKELFPWFQQWANWKSTRGSADYRYPRDDTKIKTILESTDSTILKAFKLLCLLRNFTAHIYNEQSILFDMYEECFKACLGALMYTVNYVG